MICRDEPLLKGVPIYKDDKRLIGEFISALLSLNLSKRHHANTESGPMIQQDTITE
jgi:hypothetical protein